MNWLSLGLKLAPLVVQAVHSVETLIQAKGRAKQDAALGLVADGVKLLETGIDHDVLNDEDVQAALRASIDAYVALQNAVAKAHAAKS